MRIGTWLLSKHVNDYKNKDAKGRIYNHCICIRVEINERKRKRERERGREV